MANFLDDLSVYNAKAALVISQAAADGNTEKANMMSSLKTTANDTTLSETVRLNALTALINLGSLLDIPLPPYFPLTTTYANTQTYVGIHDDLTGLQGGSPGEYYHLTLAEKIQALSAATAGDITFANLGGAYTDNASLVNGFAGKQNALSGTGFVKISGTTISYDNSTYLSSISGIAAGGELSGTYPNPALSNAAVISKVLTGFVGVSLPTPITAADSILSAMQKLNDNIASLIVSPTGVASVALTTNSSGVFTTTTTPQTGAANLDVSLNSQTANKFLASPNGSSGVPTFRAFVADDLPNSGASAGAYGSASLIPQITVDAKGRITAITTVAAAAGGQVNSVNLSIPGGIFTTPTNTGTASDPILTFGLATQTANYVWAGPVSGAAATPAFRALVADDIPSLPTSKITGLTNILSGYLTDSLSDGSIWIGNTSNAAAQRVMSGDVTISNTGVTTIGAAKVQYSMIQDVTTQTLLGRYDAVDGEVQQITLSGDFLLNSGTGVLSLSSPVSPVVTTKGDLLGHDLTAQQRVPSSNVNGDILLVNNSATGAYTDLGLNWVTMSGDATINATGAITIANAAVSLAKMANLPANRIIGNNTGSSATPLALTGTQVTAMLDQFSTAAKGLVPAASGAGDTTKYLRGDGSWQAITGTGTVTDVSVVNANGFNGSVATSTSTPAITISTTVTGILKGNGTAMSAAVAGTDIVTPGQITQTTGAGSGLTMASGNLLGRTTASAGAIEAISVNSSLTLAATTLGLNLGNGNVFTVQQQMPSLRLNGSTSGFVSFTPPATAGAQAYTLPSAFPGTGTTGYLTSNDAGVLAWASATGTTTNAVTFNNSGSGDASGTTFNGSVARTISYNTLGAQALNANLTGLSGLTYASGTPFVKMTGAGTFALDTNTYIAGTTTQYSVLVGGAGNSIVSITPVVSNRLLISNGTTSNPGWTQATYLDTIVSGGILYGSGTDSVGQIATPTTADTFLKWDGSTFTWAAAGGGGGTVTSVGILVPAFLSVTNSPITGAGDITIGLSGTALPITSGGTGGVTAITARANILPIYTANYILGVNSGGTDVEWVNITGTGNVVRATSPTLTTPNIGAATATSVNGLTITATTGTLTLVNGSTLATSGAFSTTLTATALTNVTLPTTGTLATLAGTELFTNKTINSPIIGNGVGQGHLHLHTINNNPPSSPSADYITIFADDSPKRFGFQFGLDGFESYFEFAAASTSKTYTFPNDTGTVALIDSTQTLTIPASGGTSGDIALGVSGGGTVSLLAPATVTGAGAYTLPNAYPTGASQFLTATTGGAMSWVTITGGGDVSSNTTSTTTGNFAVFADGLGKTIGESSAASLTAAGRATFNSGVDVGVSGPTGTTGTLVFRNGTTSATTTLQASTSQTANLIYTWPSAAPAAGNILSSDASGNLSWTAAGAGNMVLATAGQVVTGSKIFSDTTLLLRSSAGTAFYTTLSAGNTAANYTATFPAATGTVALLNFAQTFTAAQGFSATATFGNTVTMNAAGSFTSGQLNLSGSTINYISFGGASTLSAAPTTTTQRSAGTKIVINSTFVAGAYTDSAIGVSGSGSGGAQNWQMWFSSPGAINFYAGNATATPSIQIGANGLTLTNGWSTTSSQVTFGSNPFTNGWALMGATATSTWAAPSTTARVDGTRIVLYPVANTTTPNYDAGIGITGGTAGGLQNLHTYISSPGQIQFYSSQGAVFSINGFASTINLADGMNFVFNTTTGTKIGTATGQKIAFWNKTPIVQPTTAITGATRVGGAGTTVTTTDTYGGYTIAQIAAALVNTGILA